jgi:TonB family protein
MEPELRLLAEISTLERPRRGPVAAGTALVHLLLAVLVMVVPWGPAILQDRGGFIERPVTPIFSVPRELTQRAPNQAKPAQEVNLAGLLSRPSPEPVPQASATNPAARPRPIQAPPAAAPVAPRPVMEAPKIEGRGADISELQARALPGLGAPNVELPPPPPQIQPEEKPKLTFERPGGSTQSRNTGVAPGRLPMPAKATVDEATRAVARSGGGGLVVGDLGEGIGGIGEMLNNPTLPTRNGSALELLSDPEGVDFKPYLIRILSTVRRNWTAVMPESARRGRRGKVLIQFAINKDGSVPKLVISTGSGTDALDRAAVAGISASNPFPPLPDEFKGGQIRLQFAFSYNAPR